jgi:hypothetical protein
MAVHPLHLASARRRAAAATLPPYAYVLVERLTRLRVLTAPQAHLLTPVLARFKLRNAYFRLATLVRNGWLVLDAVSPERGCVTPRFYRPSHKTLRLLGLEHKVGLLQRPVQHVLESLLFRAEVYARATQAGWYIGSPSFLAPDKHSVVLAHLHEYLKRRALERYKAAQARCASPAELLEARAAVDQLPAFLPATLDFEFLYRVDTKARATSEVVLLLLDDVRRSADSQAKALPLAAARDCPVLVRDAESVFDVATRAVAPSRRLLELRRAATGRFGSQLLQIESVLPDIWARFARRLPIAAVVPTAVTELQE